MKIELIKITQYFYSGKQKIDIYDDFSMCIDSGEFVVIYGHSGCGKTTLLNIIGGLMKPQSGKVLFGDKSYYELSRREQDIFRGQNIGFVFQSYQLVEDLSLVDNVLISMHMRKLPKVQKVKEVKKILNNLGLSQCLNSKIKNLSGGEQQRVAIARAIAQNGDIVICDEPTGNLDEESAMGIINILLKLKEQGKTVIMVTHNSSFKKYADRVVELTQVNRLRGGENTADT